MALVSNAAHGPPHNLQQTLHTNDLQFNCFPTPHHITALACLA